MDLGVVNMLFRLPLAFIFAPPLGALIASMPGAIWLAFIENADSLVETYMLVVYATLFFAYPVMVIGILIVMSYARKNYGVNRYIFTGALLGGVVPTWLFASDFQIEKIQIILWFLYMGVASGACIATISYYIMRCTFFEETE